MNRRTLLKTALPAGLLLAGCTSQSDESDTTSPTQISSTATTGTTANQISTIKTTRLQTQTTTSRPTESTTNPETTTITESTTEQEATQTTPSTTEPAKTTTTQSTTEQTTPTTQSTTKKTTRTTQPTTEPTPTSTKRTNTTVAHSAPNHPSTKGVFDEPTRGPTPFTPDATLIAFEDPSCHNCVGFEKKIYPKLKRNHIDSGELSFVLRTIPVVEKWGARAIYALEATHARDEQAFWGLKSYYFSNQDQFDTGNVLSKTKSYIDYNTRLNGRAIVRDARSKAYDKQVQEDRYVAKDANVPGTPVFFAFRSEKFVTKIVGTQSYGIFKNVLGL